MIGTIEQVGPQRVQLYVKELAPRYILVPLAAVPPGAQKGDRVEVVVQKLDGAGELAEEAPIIVPAGTPMVNGQAIRASY